jgi:hypothetical protein
MPRRIVAAFAAWPSNDAEHFQVHERGDTWAEVTEGNGKSWERARTLRMGPGTEPRDLENGT